MDPEDPERTFAANEQELLRSEDGGRTWRGAATGEGIRLVWPAPDAFYREWVGSVPGEPYKFKATGPEALLLALSYGTVVETKDGGRTWTEAFRP